eukprot:scaffold4510_cov183-Amphora_coffeaeformis.AAC.118
MGMLLGMKAVFHLLGKLGKTGCNAPSTIYCDRSTATDSLNPIITCLLGIGFSIGLLLLLL